MPLDFRRDLTINGHTIPNTEWTAGMNYPAERRWTNGWGATIEVPAVIELLELVQAGKVTLEDVKDELTNVANAITRQHDDGLGISNDDRCFGDCDKCEARKPEVLARYARFRTNAAKARDPQYTHIVSGSSVHLPTCRHVKEVARFREPDDADIAMAVRGLAHDGYILGTEHTPVTAEELAAWRAERTGPRGGHQYRPCKTCQPTLP
uniref:PCQ3_18 n=1 Tax=Streptomyces sp. W9 TaxID=682410 RepID=D0UZ67_9ACTN|nr:hypothetical protein [Streptomyces sp. W9]ACX85519.1 pCQ3_18 [Streptomyces sp. W9]